MTARRVVRPTPARHRDPGPAQVYLVSAFALALVMALDLADGRIGLIFSAGFILIVVTAAVAVRQSGLFAVGLLPPLLLLVAAMFFGAASESSLPVAPIPDVNGMAAQTLAMLMQASGALVVGHALALAVIGIRTRVRAN